MTLAAGPVFGSGSSVVIDGVDVNTAIRPGSLTTDDTDLAP